MSTQVERDGNKANEEALDEAYLRALKRSVDRTKKVLKSVLLTAVFVSISGVIALFYLSYVALKTGIDKTPTLLFVALAVAILNVCFFVFQAIQSLRKLSELRKGDILFRVGGSTITANDLSYTSLQHIIELVRQEERPKG